MSYITDADANADVAAGEKPKTNSGPHADDLPRASAPASVVLVIRGRIGVYNVPPAVPIHLSGFALFCLGLGLFSRLDENIPTGVWVGYMFTGPFGGGLLLNTQLPAFQAPVSEADQALATGCWNFLRTLGGVWGVAIPAAIFANRVDGLVAAGRVSNPEAAAMLLGGGAYEHASAAFVRAFPSLIDQAEIIAVYRLAIQRVFLVRIAFTSFAFVICLFEKNIPLRTELVTEYGLNEDDK
ncbi:hypothetical protein M406DRAFT_334797 [Cryphonectria parasitica EP155]|uniref:Uncharacterized protein n=1 Tax=Cryphonectria parasitica (strain ATCC 38755 / EP155) TaxID=660469 RepID=A0A9P5CJE0_CRYP1|nr:uncharacterized protein M406DRAFT_334797 [Cryphonectria parasitica EP155]KAF3761194.1 hypothetical protein M406DRAFT_334797 [Cryphonectria parasitica EP155]